MFFPNIHFSKVKVLRCHFAVQVATLERLSKLGAYHLWVVSRSTRFVDYQDTGTDPRLTQAIFGAKIGRKAFWVNVAIPH